MTWMADHLPGASGRRSASSSTPGRAPFDPRELLHRDIERIPVAEEVEQART